VIKLLMSPISQPIKHVF